MTTFSIMGDSRTRVKISRNTASMEGVNILLQEFNQPIDETLTTESWLTNVDMLIEVP